MNTNYEKELQIEKQILNRLIDEALKKGTPISKTHAIIKQSKKVDNLILKSPDSSPIINCEKIPHKKPPIHLNER